MEFQLTSNNILNLVSLTANGFAANLKEKLVDSARVDRRCLGEKENVECLCVKYMYIVYIIYIFFHLFFLIIYLKSTIISGLFRVK